MGHYYTQQDSDITYRCNSYMADTLADLYEIDVSEDQPGTTCIVIENSSVYMLDTKKVWHLL